MRAYSNSFTSQPLTAENLQRVVADMVNKAGTTIGIRPDTIIIPPGLIENAIYAALAAIERLARKLAQPIKCGRYEQRQRRRAQGVDVLRLQRQLRLERRLVNEIAFLEMFEREVTL